ncbi:MAG: hypothetical protein H7249_10385 [Chitinophagaceae bacterium]|nr:hypothetical protein [Oligoflexus sp.]
MKHMMFSQRFKRPFQGRQAGTSLVELMIAASILAMIGSMSVTFFHRVDTADTEARAKANVISEITGLISTVDRDLKMRTIGTLTPLCSTGAAPCPTFTISRKVKTGVDGSGAAVYGDMNITYTNRCAQFPTMPDDSFILDKNKLDAMQGIGKSKSQISVCLVNSNVSCGKGYYSQMLITTPAGATGTPRYPRQTGNIAFFPDMGGANGTSGRKESYRKGAFAAAICGQSNTTSNNTDKVIIEAAYMSAEGNVIIDRREVIAPRGNVANIQILPN